MELVKAGVRRYPFYMYHTDHDEPRRVDEHDQEVALENKGWVTHYIHKDYPKMVNGVIVKNKVEHDKLLARELPKVTKVTLEENPDGTGEPIPTLVCEVCGKVCKSKLGLDSHMRVHKDKK